MTALTRIEKKPILTTLARIWAHNLVLRTSTGQGSGVKTTAADYMKSWKQPLDYLEADSSKSDGEQQGRVVRIEGTENTILDASIECGETKREMCGVRVMVVGSMSEYTN
ncbi:hypothetical protein Trydic_g1979 [Trypoxylus dichotomus]